MKRGRNQTVVALLATLGLGAFAAACGTEPGSSTADTAAARSGSPIDSFNQTNTSAWVPFMDEASSIATARAADHANSSGASLQITYKVASGGFAGLERLFSSPLNWSNVSAINLWVKGTNTGHTFLVQVYDAGNERWESRFTVDFTGWRQIALPFSAMTAAGWQPPDATANNVRDFSGVTGVALIPSEGGGNGVVTIDALAYGPGASATAASSATGGTSGTATATGGTTAVSAAGGTPGTTATGGTSATATGTGGTSATATGTGGTTATATGTGGTSVTATGTGGTTATATSTGGTGVTATSTGGTTAATTSTASAGLVGATGANGTIVPLYTNPGDSSWAAVAAAKQAHPTVPVIAIVNPSNGPGSALDPGYTSGIAKLTAAGVKVIGYVHTAYGSRPTSQLQSEMDQWHGWYPGVSGIFFDEMANSPGYESYYSSLGSYAKSHVGNFTVGNPGTDSAQSYVGTLDVLLIYESGGVPSLSAVTGWHASFPRANFGVIPYKVGSVDSAFIAAIRSYVGYIYLQSDDLPNPWDSVPSYLTSLVGALQ